MNRIRFTNQIRFGFVQKWGICSGSTADRIGLLTPPIPTHLPHAVVEKEIVSATTTRRRSAHSTGFSLTPEVRESPLAALDGTLKRGPSLSQRAVGVLHDSTT